MKEKNGNSSDKAIEKSVSSVTWDLSDLYNGAGDKKIKADINKGIKAADEFKSEYSGKMNKIKSASEFAKMFVNYEQCLEIINRFMQFSFLNLSLDTSSPEAKSLLSHAEEKCAEIENKLLFFNLEICALEEAVVNKFKKSKEFANYAHKIDVIRAFKPYQLSEKEEQIINIKNLNAKNYVVQLYDEFTASFRFKVKMPDGKITEMNGSQLRNLRYHQSQEMRKQSYELYMEKFNENLLVITGLYNMIVRDHAQENKLRGFKRADEPRNIANEIDNKVIDALIEVTTKNSKLVQRYYKLKAEMLKVKKLNLYDIYAPTASTTKKFDWDEAKAIVLESFKNFDPSFHKIASDFFDNKWIDAKIGANKKSGAYCSSSVPGLHPFVLMNYTGNLREVMTLAHELGHAIHAVLSSKNTMLNYHAILPLCETASIFAESVVNDDLIKKLKNRDEKITLLTSKLEDFFATSFRQNMFTRFEQEAHRQSADKLLSSADLNAIYEKELKTMFGDSVSITKDNFVEWSVIPHIFHTPFYCYSYNFALLLVLALYQSYCEKGEKFKPGFLKLLSSGSAVTPGEMLKYVDIDISDKKFWQKGFDYISSKIDELESLIK